MQGLVILTQYGVTLLQGFGVYGMWQAFWGGALFLILAGIVIAWFQRRAG